MFQLASSGLGMAIQNLAQIWGTLINLKLKVPVYTTQFYYLVYVITMAYHILARYRCFDMVRSRHLHRPNALEVNPQPAIETPTMFSVLAA